jgi:hypothetical protein
MRHPPFALCLAAALAALPALADARRAPARHPAVAADPALDTCASCHAEATPEVAGAWDAGPHGVAQVPCQVCHGSAGADFAARPGTSRCLGCHAAQVASVTTGKRTQRCFACHAPHTLAAEGRPNPHAR